MGAPGNKVSAWNVAVSAGTPVIPATLPLPTDKVEIHRMVEEVGYPVMLKAFLWVVGKGIQVIESAYELDEEGILEGVNRQQRLIMMKSIWKS